MSVPKTAASQSSESGEKRATTIQNIDQGKTNSLDITNARRTKYDSAGSVAKRHHPCIKQIKKSKQSRIEIPVCPQGRCISKQRIR